MIINKINITSFGGIKNKSFDFTDGINVIYGENEAGKSTICSFLQAMLYGMNKPQISENKVDLRKSYIPWDGGTASGSIEFTANGGKKYVLERSFGKTKRSDKYSLRFFDTWEESNDFNAENIGSEILNLSEDGFIKTVYMGQLKTKINGSNEEIIKKLSNLSETGDEEASFKKIKAELMQAKFSIIPKATAKSIMGDLKDKQKRLEEEKVEIQKANEALRSSLEEKNNIAKKITSLKEKNEVYTKEREAALEYEKFLSDEKTKQIIKGLEDRKQAEENEKNTYFEKLKKITEEEKQFAKEERKISEALSAISNLEKKKAIAAENKVKASYEEAKLNELKKMLADMDKKSNRAFTVFSLAFAAVSFVFAILLGIIVSPVWYLLFLLSLSSFAVGIIKFLSNNKLSVQKNELANEIKQGEERLFVQKNSFNTEKTENEIKEVLFSLSANSAEDLKKRISDGEALKKEADFLKKTIEMLEKNIIQTEKDINTNQNTLIGAKAPKEARSRIEVEKDFEENNNELISCEKRMSELETKISHAYDGLRTLDIVETELNSLEPEISHYLSVHSSLETALGVMEECEEELKNGFSPTLTNNISAILSSLSENKYCELKLSDGLNAMVKEPASESIVNASSLSGGTLDLVYIAVRLGILLSVFENKIPLLILDDTFLQLDDKRQKIAINMITKETNIGQGFYFTCHKSVYESFSEADNVHLMNLQSID